MFCPHCNEIHEMIPGPVTIRSVLFALRKRRLLTDEEMEQMDIEWRRYRAKHRLDGVGRQRAEQGDGPNEEEREQAHAHVEHQRRTPPHRSS
jgi:hypothetical protein